MISAGQTVIPLEAGVVAPPWMGGLGFAIQPFNPLVLGPYGEVPALEMYGARETETVSSMTTASDEAVFLPLTGAPTTPGGVAIMPATRQAQLDNHVSLYQRAKRWFGGGIPPGYVLSRGLQAASAYTHRAFGRSIDAWAIAEMLEAKAAGQKIFRIGVLGPGDGNTERELLEKAAPLAEAVGMRLEMSSITLPKHQMRPENLAAIERLSSRGVSYMPLVGNFDVDPLPFEDADIVYAIMSTIYSRNPTRLTERIYNALRPPSGSRSGGQAFVMYQDGCKQPAWGMARGAFDLIRLGIDVAVVHHEDDLRADVLMVRATPGPIAGFGRTLAELNGDLTFDYRLTRAEGPRERLAAQEPFDAFVHGASLLFSANGVDPGALSPEAHRTLWRRLSVDILHGMPIYPDAVSVAYGNRDVLDAVQQHGEGFLDALNAPKK